MANQFNSVQMTRPQGNWFDMGHDVKLSTDMGILTPTLVQEVIPGDVFKMRQETLVRFAPLVAPVMHDVSVYTHYFFVPNRLVWPNFEKFITANNGGTTVPAWPYIGITNSSANPFNRVGSLGDYLGLPSATDNTVLSLGNVSAIPFAAYQMIYNEYYRDQNLQSEVPYKLVDGIQTLSLAISNLAPIRRRAWQHDYFTSALPWPQKGAAVNIPISYNQDLPVYVRTNNTPTGSNVQWQSNNPTGNSVNAVWKTGSSSGNNIFADATGLALDGTINDLRRAFRLQEWLEKMARGGSRYTEQILAHFGVKSSDARLQRPEFIGGTKSPVIISEVLQTSESAETPQATMAGHALSANGGSSFKYRAEEHGYIIGIMSIMPKTAYQQGIDRHWTRTSYLDYAWPTFAHIGEQEVKNKEIYANGTADDNLTFGYNPRYAEYRYNSSRVAGEFRTTLAYWHLGRIFSTRPNLNSQFIECIPRNDIFAVTSGQQKLWCHVTHRIKAYRLLPKYGTPTL